MRALCLFTLLCSLPVMMLGCGNREGNAAVATASSSPEVRIVSTPDYSYYIPRTINKDGWEIPGLDKTEVEEARQWSESLSEGPAKVFHSRLRPKGQIIIDFSTYFSTDYPVPKSSAKKLEVFRIYQYDVNGRVYCYLFSVRRLDSGSRYGLAYFDEDGDGKFEVIMENDFDKLFAPEIPQGILKN